MKAPQNVHKVTLTLSSHWTHQYQQYMMSGNSVKEKQEHIQINFYSTGCTRTNCTKFKHHNLATVHHRVMPFLAQCSERKYLHYKGHCVWIRQWSIFFVIQLATKQSTWWHNTFCFHIGIYAIVLAVRRRLHGKNHFIQEPSTTELAVSHTFLQTLSCIQPFQFVCCWQKLNNTVSKHVSKSKSKSFLKYYHL